MRRLTPILVVLALVIAGCGSSGSTTSSGPTTAEFKAAFAAQKAQLKALGEDVGSAVAAAPKKSRAAITSEFQALASRATTLAGSLGQLRVPTQYKADLATLESSITQVAGALHSIGAAAAANDAPAAKAAAETLVADAQQVKSADNALSSKLGLPVAQ